MFLIAECVYDSILVLVSLVGAGCHSCMWSWFLNYSFIYTGKRYEASANIPENRAKEWYTSDFSLSKNFSWRKTAIRLTAEVNNIFNQQYEVVQCYPMPGTNVKFIINIEI